MESASDLDMALSQFVRVLMPHLCVNIESQSQRHLVATGGSRFCTFTTSTQEVEHNSFKFGQTSLKTLMMLYCEDCEFSLNAVAVATWRILMFHHCITNCCNSTPHGQIFPTFHMFDNSHGPKTWTGPYCIILIAPPTGNRKLQAPYFYCLLLAG